MTDLEKALIVAVAEATIGRGGHLAISATAEASQKWIVEWWNPDLVCPSWTQEPHESMNAALQEAGRRLGVVT